MTAPTPPTLELDDIQSGALHPRPSPYAGRHLLLRIDDRAAGRELVRRLHGIADVGRPSSDPPADGWLTVAFTYQGLKALGVPETSLESFAPEFKEGMAARAARLGDEGDSAPANWEAPLGTPDVHVAVAVLSPDAARLEAVAERAREGYADLHGVEVIWRQDCYQLPNERTSFGFRDGIGQPAVEGSGIPGTNPARAPDQGRRIHPRLSRRDRRPPAHADARGARAQRDLRGLSQAPHPRGRLSAVPAGEGGHSRGGGADGRQDGRPLAERRAAGALPRRRRSRPSAPTRSGTTRSGTATTCAASSAPPARMRAGRTRATRWTPR